MIKQKAEYQMKGDKVDKDVSGEYGQKFKV